MAVLGVVLGLAVILTLTFKKVPIGLSMLLASFVVAVFASMNVHQILENLGTALTDDMTIMLVLVVFFIGILGNLLKQTGSLDTMLNKLTVLINDVRILIILLPSVIGLLTVPGGAVLSAPMAERAGADLNISREKLCAANVVYRHLWYFIFPLYPSLIMVTEMGDIEMHHFILFNFPIVVIVFIFSFYYLFKGVTGYRQDEIVSSGSYVSDLFVLIRSVAPILIAVLLALVFSMYLPLALFIGTVVAFINYVDFKSDIPAFKSEINQRLSYVIQGMNFYMVLAIIGIMVFKDFVEASGALDIITNSLMGMGVPLEILVVVATFITGFLTGNHIAGIGIIYPILGPMFPEADYLSLMGLLFAGGVTGYMLSPMHLCLILTREYFDIPFIKMYKHFAPLIFMILLGAGVTAFAWQLL